MRPSAEMRPIVPQLLYSTVLYAVLLTRLANADLILNPSFEDVPNSQNNQGLLPTGWERAGGPSPGADTYSSDGSYGLSPGSFGHFAGVTAHDGVRWVAGATSPLGTESFGTTLNSTLIPGNSYTFSAYLYEYPGSNSSLTNASAYYLSLAKGNSQNGPVDPIQLGSLALTTGVADWEFRELTFNAPTDSALRPFLFFTPYGDGGADAYPGIDRLSLTVAPEPSAIVLLAIGGVGTVAFRRRRGSL